MIELSNRAKNVTPSVTLAASAKAKALKSKGLDILSLTVGEPDFVTPKNIQQAAIQSIEDGAASFYKPSRGITGLLNAITKQVENNTGVTYTSDQVVVTTGAKQALYVLFQTILNPADQVIIPVPYWVSYGEQVKLADGEPVLVQCRQENGFKITVEELKAAYTSKTKAILLNNPNNPTGSIYTKEELLAVANFAVEHDILIIADEIYANLVYNENAFTSIVTLSEKIKEQTILITGVSKTYAMTGWRIGYCLGNTTIIGAMVDIISQSTSNTAAVCQYAAEEALSGPQDSVEKMRLAFEKRLNTIYPKVAALPGFVLEKPQGAFYLFPEVSGAMKLTGASNVDVFVDQLLNEAKVAVVSGAGFGNDQHIRISYATDLETLEKSVDRIQQYLSQFIS